MKIEKVDGACLKGNADYKREQAKQTISQCLEKGVGVYEITDDEHTYTSIARMIEFLQIYVRHNQMNIERQFDISLATKNKMTQVFVIVKSKDS